MITCPFCSEDDFDLIGLKIHLINGHCNAYNTLSVVQKQEKRCDCGAERTDSARFGQMHMKWCTIYK